MKKRNVLETSFMCLLFLAIVSPVQAQNKSIIRGIIVDSIKKEEISSANIMVYKHDSILVANAVSGKDGTFVLKGIAEGEYTLHISHIQYSDRLLPCRQIRFICLLVTMCWTIWSSGHGGFVDKRTVIKSR